MRSILCDDAYELFVETTKRSFWSVVHMFRLRYPRCCELCVKRVEPVFVRVCRRGIGGIFVKNCEAMVHISIGSDHAGFELKERMRAWLESEHQINDCGTYSDESTDYPEYAHAVAKAVEQGDGLGILICGSANGVAMSANKHQGVRAAICWQVEIAQLARQHNDANVICIPARFVSEDIARAMVSAFLNESFEGGRHARRVGKIACA